MIAESIEQIGRLYPAACSFSEERRRMAAEISGIVDTIGLLLEYPSREAMRMNQGVEREVELYDTPDAGAVGDVIEREENAPQCVYAWSRDRPGIISKMLPTEFKIAWNLGRAVPATDDEIATYDAYLAARGRIERDLRQLQIASTPRRRNG